MVFYSKNLSKCFRFESADILCDQFSKFLNTLKKEKEEREDTYPWLDKDDERRNRPHKEILEKYVNLEKSFLPDTGKKEVMDVLFKYKAAFSLGDEIGTCPNIEVEINVTDKSLFSLDNIM